MYNPQFYMPNQRQKKEVIKVNGINGAKALELEPNESVIAVDMNEPLVWLIVSDGAGYKTVTAYDITLHEEPQAVDLIDARMQTLENKFDILITEMEKMNNGKSTNEHSWKLNEQQSNVPNGKSA